MCVSVNWSITQGWVVNITHSGRYQLAQIVSQQLAVQPFKSAGTIPIPRIPIASHRLKTGVTSRK